MSPFGPRGQLYSHTHADKQAHTHTHKEERTLRTHICFAFQCTYLETKYNQCLPCLTMSELPLC